MKFSSCSDDHNKDELVTSLAALILFDSGCDISSENIVLVISASNNQVASYWPALFAGVLSRGRIDDMVSNADPALSTVSPAGECTLTSLAGWIPPPAAERFHSSIRSCRSSEDSGSLGRLGDY